MDTIDVKIDDVVVSRDSDDTELGITLILNGEPVAGSFDPLEFALPRVKNANWYLMTCSCGIAGCAGFATGVNIKRRATTVEWRDDEVKDKNRPRKTFPKRFYQFDRIAYEAAQNKCMQLIRDVITSRVAAGIDESRYEYRDNLIPWYTFESLDGAIVRYNEYIAKYGESWAW